MAIFYSLLMSTDIVTKIGDIGNLLEVPDWSVDGVPCKHTGFHKIMHRWWIYIQMPGVMLPSIS